MKIYFYKDICEKISDKVKSVEDLFNLPVTEFDREGCDLWFDDYLSEYQERRYLVDDNCMESFYSAYYLVNVRPECDFLVLLEYDKSLFFVLSFVGIAKLTDKFLREREMLLRKVNELTDCLVGLEQFGNNGGKKK